MLVCLGLTLHEMALQVVVGMWLGRGAVCKCECLVLLQRQLFCTERQQAHLLGRSLCLTSACSLLLHKALSVSGGVKAW